MTTEVEHIVITNKHSNGRLLTDDIVYIFYKANTRLEIKDFKEGTRTYNLLAQGDQLKILVEIGKLSTATAEARKYAQENNPESPAEAIVIHSLAQRILAKFYILLHHSNHPTRIFDDKEQALEWLKSI